LAKWRAPIVAEKDEKDTSHGGTDARARFWAEFREGQRETELHAAKSRRRPGSALIHVMLPT